MKHIISLLENKGILKDLPEDKTVAAVTLAVRITNADDEVKSAFNEFAFNHAITVIVNQIIAKHIVENIKIIPCKSGIKAVKDEDDESSKKLDNKLDELFEAIADSIISGLKKEKEGK